MGDVYALRVWNDVVAINPRSDLIFRRMEFSLAESGLFRIVRNDFRANMGNNLAVGKGFPIDICSNVGQMDLTKVTS